MEEPFDYTRCSLRQLEDVARRINRERYPERYAQVIAEIEKRRADPDLNLTRPSTQSTIAGLIRFVVVEYGILALLGIVGPIALYNWPGAPQTDMPVGLLLVPITALFFAFVAICFAITRRALEPICERELALRQSLKAVLWAPFSCVVLAPPVNTARVALDFILPFSISTELEFLVLLLAVTTPPFLLSFWQTKLWYSD